MARITIHTATYNRGYILGKAYESLRRQTSKDFEWIITDDGSTDNTSELISKWMSDENGFEIVYNPLPHVGIPRALNSGIALAHTDWFMMVDSDDSILPETVEKVASWLDEIEKIPSDEKIGGVGFCKSFPNGDYMKPQRPLIDPSIGYVDATHLERSKYNLDMDCCEVHRTDLFRTHPFLYWETERYAPEQLCFYNIAFDGWKLRWRDEKLYICDYLPDGQTRDNKLVKNNPMGFAMMYNQNMKRTSSFREKFRNALQMIALSSYSHNLGYLRQCNNKFVTLMALPFGLLLGERRRVQFKKRG